LQTSDQEVGAQRAVTKPENLETGFVVVISTMKIKTMAFQRDKN
jgi:hypothetical protein